jgi:hypothetical protein
MKKYILKFGVLSALIISFNAKAYDSSDYATTERATYDALVKANDELILAGPPHKSALEAYSGAVNEYLISLEIPSPSKSLKEKDILKQK